MSSISIRNMGKAYGPATVIDDLSLDVREGEFLTLLGPSGCGKTTTLRSIAGLETPDTGQIRIDDRVMTCMTNGTRVAPHRRGLGMVFQSYAIWPHLSVFNNVAYPLRRQKVKGPELHRRVMTTLESVGLAHAANRSATLLSGGQQQRVALARAIVANPSVLLFDEPLSNLDAQLRVTMREEIQRVRAIDGTTAVYVTHDQSEAFALSDRVAVMLGGRIVQLDTPEQVVAHPANLEVARFLGVENFVRGTALSVSAGTALMDVPDLGARLEIEAPASGLSAGSSLQLAIRARDIGITSGRAAGGGNAVTGRVVQTTFLGDGAQYRVAVGESHLMVRSPLDAATLADPGTEVTLHLPPERLLVLDS